MPDRGPIPHLLDLLDLRDFLAIFDVFDVFDFLDRCERNQGLVRRDSRRRTGAAGSAASCGASAAGAGGHFDAQCAAQGVPVTGLPRGTAGVSVWRPVRASRQAAASRSSLAGAAPSQAPRRLRLGGHLGSQQRSDSVPATAFVLICITHDRRPFSANSVAACKAVHYSGPRNHVKSLRDSGLCLLASSPPTGAGPGSAQENTRHRGCGVAWREVAWRRAGPVRHPARDEVCEVYSMLGRGMNTPLSATSNSGRK